MESHFQLGSVKHSQINDECGVVAGCHNIKGTFPIRIDGSDAVNVEFIRKYSLEIISMFLLQQES